MDERESERPHSFTNNMSIFGAFAIDLDFSFLYFIIAFVCNAPKIISTPRVRHFVGHVMISLVIIPAVNAETRFASVDGKALIVKKVWNFTKCNLFFFLLKFYVQKM